MRLHFKTANGQYLNIFTDPDPEGYTLDRTEYEAVEVTDAGMDKLLRILDFNGVAYVGEPIDPPPWH